MTESLLEWHSLERPHFEKSTDWFWYLGILAVAGAVLAFYFDNFLFGIFIILGALSLGIISKRKPNEVNVRITPRSIVVGKYEYPFPNYRSFWIEDDHMHGPRILLHPLSNFIPLLSIPIADEVNIDHLRDVINDYLDEQPLRESSLHHLFDKLGI
ncbi:MAG TPA: hypothetical protein VJH67_02325 [Candidatus Paceibacterota bacterium]